MAALHLFTRLVWGLLSKMVILRIVLSMPKHTGKVSMSITEIPRRLLCLICGCLSLSFFCRNSQPLIHSVYLMYLV